MSNQGEMWRLIDRVRDSGYDWFNIQEKQRLHDLVVRFKARKTISLADLACLREMDTNLQGVAALVKTFRSRRGRGS